MKKPFKKETMIILSMLELLLPLVVIGLLLKLISDEASAWYVIGYSFGMYIAIFLSKQADKYNKRNEEIK